MFLSLKYQGRIIVFKVLFRQCKNITIKINVDGELIVTAPAGTNNEVILVALQNKVKWIINQIDYFNRLKPETRQCIEGELFLYLGKEYTLQIKHEHFLKKGQIQIKDSNIIILTSEDDKEKMKQTLELWYRQKAREKILERISLYESIIVRVPGRIVIKSQKCRWGSCSSRGNLNFNWRLVMAPVEVIDYIVVHEMCHLIELNHSYRFWSLVAQVMPNYKQNKQWLEKNGAKLGW